MRQLLLLRHAKSSWDDPMLPDHARPLNAKGRQSASGMRAAMRDLGLVPDIVLVSSSRRTLQTLEAVGPWDVVPRIEPLDLLYLAPGSTLLQVLNQVGDSARSVLVVAHNPGLHELALLLGDASAPTEAAPGGTGIGSDRRSLGRLWDAFPTGALAEFAVPSPWAELDRGGATLLRFLTPADLTEPRP